MIDVLVSMADPQGAMVQVFLDQEDFIYRVCPICVDDQESILLSEIKAASSTSLESAYCKRCEHRYFRKLPTSKWLGQYYAEEWDKGVSKSPMSQSPDLLQRMKRVLKRIPGVEMAWRLTGGRAKAEDKNLKQLRSFLEGVVESNGSYYLPHRDIRRVLEIGCGYGGRLTMFQRMGLETFGLEANRWRVLSCRKQGLEVFYCPTDDLGRAGDFGPYDFVYSVHVMEHIADVFAHFRQLAGVLREGGFVYIQVPNLWSGEIFFMQSHAAVHCHSFSLHSLVRLMTQSGFTPIRVQADNNLHVLACKSPPTEAHPAWRESASPRHLLECFSGMGRDDTSKFRISFDHARVEIMRLDDNRIMYKRNPFFNIQELPFRHRLEFRVRISEEGVNFPVRFLYEYEKPPVWIKRQ